MTKNTNDWEILLKAFLGTAKGEKLDGDVYEAVESKMIILVRTLLNNKVEEIDTFIRDNNLITDKVSYKKYRDFIEALTKLKN